MVEVLRPMSTGELLDRTFALYRKNFKLFVGIATVGPAASLVFQLLTVTSAGLPAATGRTPNAFAGASFGIGVLAGIVIMLAGMAIANAATVKAVAAVHLGRPITIAESYKSLKGRIWRILGVFLLVLLLVFIGTVIIVIVASLLGSLAVIGGAQAGRAGTILGIVGAIAAAVIGAMLAITIYVRYALAIPACVVEDTGVLASLKRSAFLSKGSRSRILAVYSVFFVLALVVALALTGLVGLIAILIPNVITRLILNSLAGFISGSLTGPLATIGIALVYYDERVRKEAFDLQWMMASLDAPVPAAVAVVPAQI
jgi:hypothetical protein